MSSALPVLDILNNTITVNNYLWAVQSTVLPDAIASDPNNKKAVDAYQSWQVTLWQSYYEGVLNLQILSQIEQVNQLYSDNVASQSNIQAVLVGENSPTPPTVASIDALVSLIDGAQPLLADLEEIAAAIEGADEEQVAQLQGIVDALSAAFDQEEDELSSDAISSGTDLIASAIDVGIAVATEGEAIGPLVKGVTKIGTDIITEVILSAEISADLDRLVKAWADLDQATADLAQMKFAVAQLESVLTQEQNTISALNAIVEDWSTVIDVVSGSASSWDKSGNHAVKEWSSRMGQVSFSTQRQIIQPDSITE